MKSKSPNLDDLIVREECVVPEVAEHGRVELGDRHLVAGLAHGGDGLDMVEVTVGLEYAAHTETTGEFEQAFVLVQRTTKTLLS